MHSNGTIWLIFMNYIIFNEFDIWWGPYFVNQKKNSENFSGDQIPRPYSGMVNLQKHTIPSYNIGEWYNILKIFWINSVNIYFCTITSKMTLFLTHFGSLWPYPDRPGSQIGLKLKVFPRPLIQDICDISAITIAHFKAKSLFWTLFNRPYFVTLPGPQ